MRRLLSIIAVTAALALPASAQDFMDADAFDAYATGNTIYWNNGSGTHAGIEAYHPNRRVTWIAEGGICQKGTWEQVGEEICFTYQGQDLPACWRFYDDGGTFNALPSLGAAPWAASQITTSPIPCTSPFVGS